MEDLETSAVLEFHGARYVVTVQVQQQLLHVQVEVAAAGTGTWTGRFPASDVEQLTRQTGNSKRFPVFVQMLLTALHRRSDAVFVDLLTAADLDLYRQRKLQPGTATEGLGAATATSNGKRFLILTYAVEFDRVHYPLPLTPELSPSPEVLQRTIRRLRQALAEQDKGAASEGESQLAQENAALREENRCLKNTLKQYCDGNGVSSTGELQRELEASVEENKELIALYQQFREDSALETAHLRTEIKQLRLESQQSNRSELAKQEHERLETRRKVKDSNAAVQETLAQMVQMKAQLEETQLKNRELLRQLAIAQAGLLQHGRCDPREVQRPGSSSKPAVQFFQHDFNPRLPITVLQTTKTLVKEPPGVLDAEGPRRPDLLSVASIRLLISKTKSASYAKLGHAQTRAHAHRVPMAGIRRTAQ
ncbi:Variable flagella 3 [Phytophthora ramorum]|uniref:Variable flagella 3 n=1 Tax=Phytophthora ramorum TaxID=164328 RepID=UPI00309705E7|nr:Variable flagella 3 [Phytophthora ramorum]